MSDLSLKSWWEWDGMENSDLWYNCRFDNFTGTWLCASSKETGKAPFHFVHLHKSDMNRWNLGTNIGYVYGNVFSEWLQAVQVLMVLSVVFSSVSFLVFLGQLFTMSKGGLFYFTGLCQVFAGNSGVQQCAADIYLCNEIIWNEWGLRIVVLEYKSLLVGKNLILYLPDVFVPLSFVIIHCKLPKHTVPINNGIEYSGCNFVVYSWLWLNWYKFV